MKKILSFASIALSISSACWSADNATQEKEIQELIKQNKLLMERIINLEKIVGTVGVGENCPVPGHTAQTEKNLADQPSGPTVDSITERLRQVENIIEKSKVALDENKKTSPLGPGKCQAQIGGLIELEAFNKEDFNQSETSDISLATVEVALDVHLTDWSHGRLVFLYEEGDDEHLLVDEGTVTLGNMELFPVAITVGKKYLPFGSYLTSMISDPLSLTLGEISDSAIQTDFQISSLYGSAYIFNGDINVSGKDDKIDSYGVTFGFADVIGDLSYDISMDWINNIGDTDSIGEYLINSSNDEIDEYVEGFSAHMLMAYGSFNFFAEYVSALQSFDSSEISFRGEGARPRAWGGEIGYNTILLNKDTLFSIGYQASREAISLDMPEKRFLASARFSLLTNTSLALEYTHDEDYGSEDGGTDETADTTIMQIAVEF